MEEDLNRDPEPEEDQGQGQRIKRRREIFSWIRLVIIVILVVFVLMRFVIINATVPSGSMEPTVMTKDRLIGFRFSYWFGEPDRGDIVLFKYPVDESVMYIKRVIGLPGETVDIRDGKVYIDGSDIPLEEDYINGEWYWENNGLHYEVPEGCYFVMGDNRNNSADSRVWADEALAAGLAQTAEEAEKYTYVTDRELRGKAIFTYYRQFKLLTKTADYDTE